MSTGPLHVYTDGTHFTVSSTMRSARRIAVRASYQLKTRCRDVAPLDEWRRVPDRESFRIYWDISDNIHETCTAGEWAAQGPRYLTEAE